LGKIKMKLFRLTYSLIYLVFLSVNIFAQDTTFFDSKINYYSTNEDSTRYDISQRSKRFPRVDYAREVIHFENGNLKVENCYYLDNERYTNNKITNYKIVNDSILIVENQKWHFEKLNDSIFYVSKKSEEYIEKGNVSSLVPLIKQGNFLILNKNNKLLVIEQYLNGKLMTFESPKINLEDSIYRKVDMKPLFPIKYGNLDNYISKRCKYPDIVLESSIQGKVYVEFIITSNGEVVNAEILRGVNRFLDREAIKIVANLPDFESGKIMSKNVNSYYILPVKFILR